ncbi:hypothetical protein A2U01_0061375, partial [Trifolium medium]|nr:hypothetical protein [Trifolium medium]
MVWGACFEKGGGRVRYFFLDRSLGGWDSFVVGADGEAWEWRRQLRVWDEELLGECDQSLLLNLSLQAQSSDRWQWQPDPDKGYT